MPRQAKEQTDTVDTDNVEVASGQDAGSEKTEITSIKTYESTDKFEVVNFDSICVVPNGFSHRIFDKGVKLTAKQLGFEEDGGKEIERLLELGAIKEL